MPSGLRAKVMILRERFQLSMLKALVGDLQMASAREDYQETSIMLHYNQRYAAM
jgi:hypothetical protein